MKKYSGLVLSGLMLFLFSFKPQESTVRNYDIHVAGIRVGSLTATREIKDGLTLYKLSSDVSIFMGIRYHIKDEVTSIYRNNQLQSSSIKTSVGQNRYTSSITWVSDHYDIDIKGYHYEKKGTESMPIEYSVARIYFDEPPVSAKVFSEDYGVFSEISQLSPHKVQLIFIGKKDKFIFQEGLMNKADMQSTVRDFVILLK